MPGPEIVSTRLQRIAELARNAPDMVITTLAHHLDEILLHTAYLRTRKDGAAGVDGVTAREYAYGDDRFHERLSDLRERAKSGLYKAPPVKRAHIPKGEGKTRPIGIPTFEDKLLQRAVAMLLEAVYEQDFLDCSHGFRPDRSPHTALDALRSETMRLGGGWILEADIQGFFDHLDHGHLRSFLDQRVRDGVIRRLIGKWLNAGVMEDGAWHRSSEGTPQGGVISPLLANVYLHEVLDKWFEREVRPRLGGAAVLIRYADDFVILFTSEEDARRVMDVLAKRFAKYGLTLHPDKTRLVPFHRPPRSAGRAPKPGSFDFLGFTHTWGRSRRGHWVVRQRTMSKRIRRTLHAISEWCRRHRHWTLREQQRTLNAKLTGHYNYYGVTGNYRALASVFHQVRRIWKKWLDRRSRKAHRNWERFALLLEHYPLTTPRVARSIYRSAANP